MTNELELVHGYLQATRRHVLGIVDGLVDAALHRAVLPTGWTCTSMLSHLTHDGEHFWCRAVMAAEPEMVAFYEGEPGDAWQVDADVDGAQMIEAYRSACERSDAIIQAMSPTAPLGWWPDDLFGDWQPTDLRDIVMHVVVETATHAGHLDAARELIDGRTWMVLD